MILIGCVLGPKAADRAVELKKLKEDRRKTGPVEYLVVDDFLRAAYLAEEKVSEGHVVSVAGSMSDLTLPPPLSVEGIGDQEWRESWQRRLERGKIGFIPLDVANQPPIPRESLLATAILRKYDRASKALDTAIREMQAVERQARAEQKALSSGYVGGRPPYGYRAINGQLIKDSRQAESVKLIFKSMRDGSSGYMILTALKEAKAKGYWDGVKVRRILRHARLYCLGECTFRGKTVTVPDLAFLPADWVDTYTPCAAATSKDTP